MPVTSFARVFAIALAAALSCQPATGQGFAPSALAVPSTITYDGTSYDVVDGETYSDSGSVTTTSATTFTGTVDGEDVTGTFSYTKNGPNTAGRSYTATTSGPGYWYSESGTFNLTFTSATGGTYTASGSYQGNYFGMAFSGSFINGVGTFTYSVPDPVIVVEQPAGTNIANGGSKGFGSVGIGSSLPLTFTIRNIGNANLTGLAITKDGTHATNFTVGALGATTLAPGTSTTFTVTFSPSASGSRNAAIHIASNDTDKNPFDINLTGTGLSSLETWRQTHFGSPADSGDGANSNDFDKDGIPNLLEFAFGLHPKQNSAGLLPKPQSTGGNLVLTFTQPAAVNGITYGAEWSPSMAPGSWQSLTNTGTSPQYTFSTPIDGNMKKFVRLKVTVP